VQSLQKLITSFAFLGICLYLSSCSKERPVNFFVGKPIIVDIKDPKPASSPDLKFKFSNLDLYQDIGSLNFDQFKKFGTFYTRDFTIYHIKDLDLLEDNLYIVEIYLYFIDSTLHKIQAHTTKNMSDFFLSKYGGAKLILMDRFNKELMMQEGAISRNAGKYHMNKNLNNYKLRWKGNDRLISYKVDESDQKNFEVIEELVNIENQERIRIKPDYIFTIESKEYQNLLARVKVDEQNGHEKLRSLLDPG
jgi:hypothetical protein